MASKGLTGLCPRACIPSMARSFTYFWLIGADVYETFFSFDLRKKVTTVTGPKKLR